MNGDRDQIETLKQSLANALDEIKRLKAEPCDRLHVDEIKCCCRMIKTGGEHEPSCDFVQFGLVKQ